MMTAPKKTKRNRAKTKYAFTCTLENYIRNAHVKSLHEGFPFAVMHCVISAKETIPYSEFKKRWGNWLRGIKRKFKSFSCIRIFEEHTGEAMESEELEGEVSWVSHGLHVHLLCDRLYPIEIMQRIAWKVGLGWVHVSKWNSDTQEEISASISGLGKYLQKQFGESGGGIKGMHKWKPINCSESRVTVREVVTISRWRVVYDRLAEMPWFSAYRSLTKLEIASEAEKISRLIGSDAEKAREIIRKMNSEGYFDGWVCSPMEVAEALLPNFPDSPHYKIDREYDYMEINNGKWPGVDAYLNWLQSPEGMRWAVAQNEEKIKSDRERERNRRRVKAAWKLEKKAE